ncbi:N-terminal acetyltransferase [Gryganskiella cystojenkinii]|nr:N-terminal acetyltransferase [Gryganskiella cystojenkinii]
MLSQEQLANYFERIGFVSKGQTGNLPPTLKLLKKIQGLQLNSIPYENLSLHWRPIQQTSDSAQTSNGVAADVHVLRTPPEDFSSASSLSPQALFQKLVLNRRGGYCLELNLLLGSVLQALGFEVVKVKAKIVFDFDRIAERLQREREAVSVDVEGDNDRGLIMQEVREWESFDVRNRATQDEWETYQMLIVKAPGSEGKKRWLVDVGLAKYSILEPIELLASEPGHSQGCGVLGKQFQLSSDLNSTDDRWNLAVRMSNNSCIWYPYYTFLAQEVPMDQLEMMHHYMSRSPSSTSPPEPFATMPLALSSLGCHNADIDSEVEVTGQVTMQGMKLTVQRWKGAWLIEEDDQILAKDEIERQRLLHQYFGIEGYMNGAALVLADDPRFADSW